MSKKIKKVIRFIIKSILLAILLINSYEIGYKQYQYISSNVVYKQVRKEKDQAPSVPGYLYTKEYDWIKVTESKIDYPLMKTHDNNYYLNHNYKDEYDVAGSIYYDSSDEPYNGNLTVIYGHAMRNGSMFKSLHNFRDDHQRFLKSELTIYTKERKTVYKPIGYRIYSHTDLSYRQIDTMTPNEITNYLTQNCNYFNGANITEDTHIMGLVTCEYSITEGRIIVFYIEDK